MQYIMTRTESPPSPVGLFYYVLEGCLMHIQTIGDYVIYTVGKYPGYSVKCTKGAYCNHAHKLPTIGMARQLIYWVTHKIIPDSAFYRESCKRLTTDEYYKERLTNHKDKDGFYKARGR